MMLMHNLPVSLDRAIRGTIERAELNTGPVTLDWISYPAGVFDKNIEGDRPTGTPATKIVHAFIQFVNQDMVREEFAEFHAGLAILTFEADVEIDGLASLTFTLPDGNIYVTDKTGTDVTKYWDLVIGGLRMSRTVALKLKG